MSIVIWPPVSAEWIAAIRDAAGEREVAAPQSEAEAGEAAREAEGWIGRLTPEMLAAAPRLRWLQATSISLEGVVFPELADHPVTLTHLRHIYDDHIANHVLALLLAHCRGLPRLIRRQAERKWSPGDAAGLDPSAMTVLILGLGGIGSEFARRVSVLGARVVGLDPRVEAPPPGVDELDRPERLADRLPEADVVAVCAPLTPETMGLFDEAMFRRMKPAAYFINIGRGKIVRLAALERALEEGWIAGAGLDVFEEEPLPPDSPLWGREDVILTPHVAGKGPGTEARRLRVIVENVKRFVSGKPLLYVADKRQWY
ncbi:MAG: D-2-hydroxyacid dehydrogenase [Armatimonadetes bacterium]|nr:D-2-hydroxyacid dehydrogenase [Armatimonadota bacterium]